MKATPLIDQIWDELRRSPQVQTNLTPNKGVALPFGLDAPANTFWVMSRAMAEAIAAEAGVEFMSMRGTRLFGLPVLFSDSVLDPILAFDSPDSVSTSWSTEPDEAPDRA